jgi:hypothetical protein
MSWAYATGVLTSTGATEGSPDSLLAGIAIVQAADSTKGYRSLLVAWLNDVEVRAGGSFIRFDADAQIDLRGSSFINPGNGGVIHGYRSTYIISTTTARIDGTLNFETGSSFIVQRERPNDPNPRIVYKTSTRHDYPNIQAGSTPAKVAIAGLDLYGSLTGGQFLKLYFGLATTASVSNIRVFNSANAQVFSSTYNDTYTESFDLSSEGTNNTCTFNRPTFYKSGAVEFTGAIRSATHILNNPTFLNNAWNGTLGFYGANASAKWMIQYSYANTFKQGLTALSSVNVRFTRARQSVNGSPTWTAPNSSYAATSDGAGQYTAISLLDAYYEGTVGTHLERFNWTAKARRYDVRTPGETIFASRVFYAGNVNLSQGYSEEVQMLSVLNLTLTQVEAAALTNIAFSPSGATGGTVTASASRTLDEVWAAYRNWISQTANFDSEDTWTVEGDALNPAAWNQSVSSGTLSSGTKCVSLIVASTLTAPVAQVTAPCNLTGTGVWSSSDIGTLSSGSSFASGAKLKITGGASAGIVDGRNATFASGSIFENTSGTNKVLRLNVGQTVPTILATSGSITVDNLTRDVIAISGLSAAYYSIQDGGGTQLAYAGPVTGAISYSATPGATGTYAVRISRQGFAPLVQSVVLDGTTHQINGTLSQRLNFDGTACYTGTTSAAVTISINSPSAGQVRADIGNASVDAQIVYDMLCDALVTSAGIVLGQDAVFLADPVGYHLLGLSSDIEFRRRSGGDVAAEVRGIVSQAASMPVDETNGQVRIVGTNQMPTAQQFRDAMALALSVGTTASAGSVDSKIDAIKAKTDNLPASPAAVSDIPSAATNAAAVRTNLATELARVDAAVSSRNAIAPDNSGIAAINARLPADPADASDVAAQIAAIPAAPTTAQIADRILGRNIAGGSDGGRTVSDSHRAARNRVEIVGNTLTVYREDDVTPAWTATIATAKRDALQGVDPA